MEPSLLQVQGSLACVCKTIDIRDNNRAVALRPWPLSGLTVNSLEQNRARAAGFFHHWPLLFLGARWHYIHEKKKMLRVIMLTRRCYFHLITLFGALFDVQNTSKIMKCLGSWLMAGKVQTLH